VNVKIYEPKFDPCRICNLRQSILLPICKDGERQFVYPVCLECRDKVPYEVVPIKCELGEGFFFCPDR